MKIKSINTKNKKDKIKLILPKMENKNNMGKCI